MKLSFLFCLFTAAASGQNEQQASLAFVSHLSKDGRHQEAIRMLYIERALYQADTFNFNLARQYHLLRKADSASAIFSRVSPVSAFGTAARFGAALNFIYLNDPEKARTELETITDTALGNMELRQLTLAGIALLQREEARFDSIAQYFRFTSYLVSSEERTLVDLRKRVSAKRRKSAIAAAGLSAIVPGLGKIYAGRKGAGLASMLASSVLAGIAAETYFRGGAQSAQFITAGALFGVFYAGNIVGSYYSVRQQKKTETGKFDNEILATIHLPIHRRFLY